MSGLDDLVNSVTKSSGGGSGGGGLDDLLGGLLGGGGAGAQAGGGGAGGLGDILGGLLGGGSGGAPGTKAGGMNIGALAMALTPLLAKFLSGGGLSKVLSGAQASGLSDQASSWVGTGDNIPVSGQEIKNVVGDDAVKQVAQDAGISEDEAADVLAKVVPQVVSGLTPNGQVPSEDELGKLAQQFGAN